MAKSSTKKPKRSEMLRIAQENFADARIRLKSISGLIELKSVEVEGIKTPFGDQFYLYLTPKQEQIFLILSKQGLKVTQIRKSLDSLKRPTLAVLVSTLPELMVIGRGTEYKILPGDLNLDKITRMLYSPPPNILQQRYPVPGIKNDPKRAAIPPFYETKSTPSPSEVVQLMNLSEFRPEQAKELEHYVTALISTREKNPEIWQAVAEVSITNLPLVLKNAELRNSLITTIARSVIFLPTNARLQAVKSMLDIATSPEASLELSERLSSILLAIAPTLNSAELVSIVRPLRAKLKVGEKIAPSMAQFMSATLSRAPTS